MTDSSDVLAEPLSLTLTVDEFGTRIYRNSLGELHRIHGPAVISPSGNQYWYRNDKPHRTTGPAIELANGDKWWWLNGKHSSGGRIS